MLFTPAPAQLVIFGAFPPACLKLRYINDPLPDQNGSTFGCSPGSSPRMHCHNVQDLMVMVCICDKIIGVRGYPGNRRLVLSEPGSAQGWINNV